MKIVIVAMCSLLLMGLCLALYARLKPLPNARFSSVSGPVAPGKHVLDGGVKYVLPLGDLPPNAMAQLSQIIKRTPRTVPHDALKGQAFVTRSKLFGFPDITWMWEQDGHLHLFAHLVIGKSDLGVNAARVDGWLKQLLDQS